MNISIKSNIVVTVLIITLSQCNSPSQQPLVEKSIQPIKEKAMPEKELKHIVTFKFKEDTPVSEVAKINEAFVALPDAIPVIKNFEWGLNDSPENFHQDFTHCYILTFTSEYDRDSVYTPHHSHQAFVDSLQPYLEKVFVVDFWTNP